MLRSLQLSVGLVALALLPCTLHADLWVAPTPFFSPSPDGSHALLVIPRGTPYRGKPMGGAFERIDVQTKEAVDHARALLLKRHPDGRYTAIRQIRLVNPATPVTAVVSNDARSIVTLDDHGGAGYGENVVAIYDASGEVLERYRLEDLLPKDVLARVPHSVSSRHWADRGHIQMRGDEVHIRVQLSLVEDSDDGDPYVVRFRLSDGELLTPKADPVIAIVAGQEIRISAVGTPGRGGIERFERDVVYAIQRRLIQWYAEVRDLEPSETQVRAYLAHMETRPSPAGGARHSRAQREVRERMILVSLYEEYGGRMTYETPWSKAAVPDAFIGFIRHALESDVVRIVDDRYAEAFEEALATYDEEPEPYIVADPELVAFTLEMPRHQRSPQELYEVGLVPQHGRTDVQSFMRSDEGRAIAKRFRVWIEEQQGD